MSRHPFWALKLYPGAARSLVDAALRAGWVVSAGPDAADPSLYNLALARLPGVTHFAARWKRGEGGWSIRFAERRHNPPGGPFRTDEVRLDEIAGAIKASVGAQ